MFNFTKLCYRFFCKFNNTQHMETNNKVRYEAPQMEVVRMEPWGMVCGSSTETSGSPTFNSMNNEEIW